MPAAKRKFAIGKAALAAASLASLLAPAPAVAEDARAVLSVTAIVLPTCQVAQRPATRSRADVACSTGTSFSTMTASRPGERPLDDAARILGAPVRRGGEVRFTSAVQPAGAAESSGPDGTRYLTVTY